MKTLIFILTLSTMLFADAQWWIENAQIAFVLGAVPVGCILIVLILMGIGKFVKTGASLTKDLFKDDD